MAEENTADKTVTVAKLAKVQDIEFASKFAQNIESLMKMLGVTDLIPVVPGTTLKMYKTTGTLEDGTVAEGAEIPLSEYKTEVVKTVEPKLEKWRKKTTLEAIMRRGYDQAVTSTDTAMMYDIQGKIQSGFTAFLASGTGSATGTSLQGALAQTWGQLQKLYGKTHATPVYFVSVLDVADYLAGASVSTQTAFGMTYLENFLGLGNCIALPDLEKGSVYGTATENINGYFMDPSSAEGFDFYSDETGLVGVHHDTHYTNASLETVAVSGVTFFAEYADRIVKATISAAV